MQIAKVLETDITDLLKNDDLSLTVSNNKFHDHSSVFQNFYFAQKEQYEDQIQSLKEEIKFLRDQITSTKKSN
ncbi:MAG: hypothetical protein ACK4K0_12135 [Flavobacteriales bacterium]